MVVPSSLCSPDLSAPLWSSALPWWSLAPPAPAWLSSGPLWWFQAPSALLWWYPAPPLASVLSCSPWLTASAWSPCQTMFLYIDLALHHSSLITSTPPPSLCLEGALMFWDSCFVVFFCPLLFLHLLPFGPCSYYPFLPNFLVYISVTVCWLLLYAFMLDFCVSMIPCFLRLPVLLLVWIIIKTPNCIWIHLTLSSLWPYSNNIS